MSTVESPESARVIGEFLLSRGNSIRRALDRLDFEIEGFRIDPAGFREIGHKFLQRAISVFEQQGAASGHLGAAYTDRLDKMTLTAAPRLTGTGRTVVIDQAGIVHECTHALMDFHGARTTGAIHESAAYTAGAVYAVGFNVLLSSSSTRSNAILQAANAIATGRRFGNGTVRLAAGDQDVAALVQAIRSHTAAYPDADSISGTDGIREGLMNPWYLPRYI